MFDLRPHLLATMLLLAATTHAQTVHRCVDADGQRVYADRACHFLGLAEQAPAAPPAPAAALAADPSTVVDSGPVPAAEGCPGPTPDALREAVLAAIALRDLNALTGMYYWAGAGRGAASAVINRMEALIAQAPRVAELQDAEASDDWLWAGLPPPSETSPPQLVLLTTAESFEPLMRFQLRRQAGCYWLSTR